MNITIGFSASNRSIPNLKRKANDSWDDNIQKSRKIGYIFAYRERSRITDRVRKMDLDQIIAKEGAMPTTTSDANNKRCHIVSSFYITEHRGTHLANRLIMPAFMRDAGNHTRCQRSWVIAVTTYDASNHTRSREQRPVPATTRDVSNNTRCDTRNNTRCQLPWAMSAIRSINSIMHSWQQLSNNKTIWNWKNINQRTFNLNAYHERFFNIIYIEISN